MSYQATGYPQNKSIYVPQSFRDEFNKIQGAFQDTASKSAVAKGELLFATEREDTRSPSVYELTVDNGVGFSDGYPDGTTVWWVPRRNNVGDANIRLNLGPLRPVRQYVRSGANEDEVQSEPLPANTILQGQLTGVMFAGGVGRIIYPLGTQNVEINFDDEFSSLITPIQVSSVLKSENILPNVWYNLFQDPVDRWNRYNDLVFTLDTPTGRLTRTIPTTAIKNKDGITVEEYNDETQTGKFQHEDSHVLVFGERDGVSMWIAPSSRVAGRIMIATTDTQFTPHLSVYGRTSPGTFIQYASVDSWVPQFRFLTRQSENTPSKTETFLQVTGYDAGVPGLPQPASPYIIGPSGKILPDADTTTTTDDGLGNYPDASLEGAAILQVEDISGTWTAVGNQIGREWTATTGDQERIIRKRDVQSHGRNIVITGDFSNSLISTGKSWPVLNMYGDIDKPIRINNVSVSPFSVRGCKHWPDLMFTNLNEQWPKPVVGNITVKPGQSRVVTPIDTTDAVYFVCDGNTNHTMRLGRVFRQTLTEEQQDLLPTMSLVTGGTAIQTIETGEIPSISDWFFIETDENENPQLRTIIERRSGLVNADAYGAENILFAPLDVDEANMGADNDRPYFVMRVGLTANQQFWRLGEFTIQNRNQTYPLVLVGRNQLDGPQVILQPYESTSWNIYDQSAV